MRARSIRLGGNPFRYLERPGGTPILLCLHGLGDSADQFEPIAGHLPPAWRILALDQRGHGGSWKGGESYAPEDFSTDAARFLEALGLGGAHLFGHSMGGRNALVLAARHPERVRSLVLGDIGPEKNLDDIEQTRAFFESLPDSFPSPAAARRHWRERKPSYDEASLDLLMRNLEEAPGGGLVWRFSKAACIASVAAARSRDWWEMLPEVRCPVLLLHAERSTELSPEVAQRMRRELAGVRYAHVPDSGHNFHLENPRFAAAEIRTFIESVEKPR